jgi:hypothetical protein
MASIFRGNEKTVTFKTYSFDNNFDTKNEASTFDMSGLVSHQSGANLSGSPSDSAHSTTLRVYFRADSRLDALSPSSTAVVDGLSYSVTDIDMRAVAPTRYRFAITLEREVA